MRTAKVKRRISRISATASRGAPDRVQLGAFVRRARKDGGITLKELSRRSGVALSTLSKMELGQVSVGYEKLAAVATALGVDLAQMFDPRVRAAAAARPTVVRSRFDSAPAYDAGTYDYRMLATEYPHKRMTPIFGVIRARTLAEFPDFVRHAGEEFLLVLSGTIRILFETGESLLLGREESAYFDSGVGHVYLSRGRAPARIMVVMVG